MLSVYMNYHSPSIYFQSVCVFIFRVCLLYTVYLLFFVVQLLSCVWLFVTPWTAAYQASWSFTVPHTWFKLLSIELVMPSNHIIFCHPLFLLPSIFPSIRIFSSESVLCIRWPKYWSFNFIISPSNEYSGLHAARLHCSSPTPGACSNSCPSSWWCHPTISTSVFPFSSCFQSFPASGSFPMRQFFASGGQSMGVSASASVLPMNIQDWFPLGLTSLISLQSKRISRVFSNTTVQKH